MTVGKLPEDSLLIFAGSADIETSNMEELLQNHIPRNLAPPVIQAKIPPRYLGLRKISDWLDGQFPDEDDIDEVDDVLEYLSVIENTENAYLIVLWGAGGDQATEELVDAAMRRGITVLDLTAGLDDLNLKDEPPGPSQPGKDRRTRTSRTAITAEPAAAGIAEGTAQQKYAEQPAWENQLAELLYTAFQGAAEALRDKHRGTLATVSVLEDHQRAASQVTPAGKPSRSPVKPAARQQSRRQQGDDSAEETPATRTWLQNPDDPGSYAYKDPNRRGRPRNAYKDWKEVRLTESEERRLGLVIPGKTQS